MQICEVEGNTSDRLRMMTKFWCLKKIKWQWHTHSSIGHLGHRFIEEEVWSIVRSLPPDKAPGLDGFMA
jgi:hypothetical protein